MGLPVKTDFGSLPTGPMGWNRPAGQAAAGANAIPDQRLQTLYSALLPIGTLTPADTLYGSNEKFSASQPLLMRLGPQQRL